MRSLQVWFAHKRVCGENCSPFVFPVLSKEECARALSILDDLGSWAMEVSTTAYVLELHGCGMRYRRKRVNRCQ
jgi:hypothetical protein